jgi:hypothetical protein
MPIQLEMLESIEIDKVLETTMTIKAVQDLAG